MFFFCKAGELMLYFYLFCFIAFLMSLNAVVTPAFRSGMLSMSRSRCDPSVMYDVVCLLSDRRLSAVCTEDELLPEAPGDDAYRAGGGGQQKPDPHPPARHLRPPPGHPGLPGLRLL